MLFNGLALARPASNGSARRKNGNAGRPRPQSAGEAGLIMASPAQILEDLTSRKTPFQPESTDRKHFQLKPPGLLLFGDARTYIGVFQQLSVLKNVDILLIFTSS